MYGAVVLHETQSSLAPVTLTFVSRNYLLREDDFCYSLDTYDKDSIISSHQYLENPVHSPKINDCDTINATLQIADVFDEKVVILDLTVSSNAKARRFQQSMKTKVWSPVKCRFKEVGKRPNISSNNKKPN